MDIKTPSADNLKWNTSAIFNINTSVTLVQRYCTSFIMGRDCSVDIVIRYELDRTGIESR